MVSVAPQRNPEAPPGLSLCPSQEFFAYPRIAVDVFKVAEASDPSSGDSRFLAPRALGLLFGRPGFLFPEVDVVGNLVGGEPREQV